MMEDLNDLCSIGVLVVGVGNISKAKYNEYFQMLAGSTDFKVAELPLAHKSRMCGNYNIHHLLADKCKTLLIMNTAKLCKSFGSRPLSIIPARHRRHRVQNTVRRCNPAAVYAPTTRCRGV
jgi:hypothetical protein